MHQCWSHKQVLGLEKPIEKLCLKTLKQPKVSNKGRPQKTYSKNSGCRAHSLTGLRLRGCLKGSH